MESVGIVLTGENGHTQSNISATLSTTNPTWHGLELKKWGRTDDKKNGRKELERERRRGEWQVKRNLEQRENEKNTSIELSFSKLMLV